ncbi:MAG: MFS transporter [Dehalococcoidia bacterium]
MTERARSLFYLIAFPVGHFSVDTPGGALWLLAPAIGVAWDLSPAQIGFLITAHNLGGGLAYLPFGIVGDRFSKRGPLLVMALVWVAFGYLAASLAPSYWVLVVLLPVAAWGSAAWHPMATGTMVQRMPKQRALALGVHLTGGIMAEVIAPLSAGFLLNVMDWRTVLQISVVPAGIMSVSFLYLSRFVEPSSETAITRRDLLEVLEVWRHPPGIAMFVMGITYNMSFIALLAMLPLFLQDHHGYSTSEAGIVFAVALLAGGVAAPVMGRYSDDIGRKRLLVGSMVVVGGATALIAFSGAAFPLILGAVIAGSLLVGARPVLLAAAVDMAGKRESTSLGLIYAVMDGVGALGGLLAGLAGSGDLRYAMVFAAAMALLTAVIAALHPFGSAVRSFEPALDATDAPA